MHHHVGRAGGEVVAAAAGHAAHLEQPRRTAEVLSDFLDSADGS